MSASIEIAAWDQLATYLQTEFYQPDLEALRIVLAACRAQYHPGEPIWLFVVGPPGSGKTSVVINAVSALPTSWVESSITERTLLSCASQGKETSLLLRMGSGILAFKDFTTILSKNDESQREIVSQLREVYDGSYKSKTGVEWREWEGKVTVIAAVTPAIERAWAVHRDLGERFMQVRWPNRDGAKVAAMARRQRGREKQIVNTLKTRVTAFFHKEGPTPQVTEKQGFFIDSLATAIAQLRGHVVRDGKEVVDVSPLEEPSRLAKSLESIAVHHAALFNREPEPQDMGAVMRLGLDTIPSKRLRIVQSIPPGSLISVQEICSLTKIPRGTINRPLEDLENLLVIEQSDDAVLGKKVTFTKDFLDIWEGCQIFPPPL